VLVPIHIEPAAVDALIDGLGAVHNLDGISATVPHKFTAYRHANTTSQRAHLLTAANILRRHADGSWHGDMLDGIAMVGSIRNAGCEPAARRALLVGAGGAGGAIALSLLDAGVTELAVHDSDAERRDALVERLRTHHGGRVVVGSADPTGFTLVVNATPAGMKPDDPLPIIADRLTPQTFVADVITNPVVTPLLEAARRVGCDTQTGIGMFNAELDLMVDFWLGASV
jgi:shikimate dehydrogenase